MRLTAVEIAERLRMPISTVSAVLRREGLGKRSRLEPPEPVNRYERSAPGELVHIDVKKLGRIVGGPGKRITGRAGPARGPTKTRRRRRSPRRVGWECLHVAIDDYSRLAYAEVLDDEKATTAIAFLRRAVAFFARHGITVERVMTDNGSAYVSARPPPSPATSSASATCAPGPTARAPTAKPSASSRPCCAAGPTAAPTAQAPNAPPRSAPGSTTTTSSDRTAASASKPPGSRLTKAPRNNT